ncbi:MAG: YgiT-type zinc finger protein [Verrucomicrobiota bacterium]
MNPSNPICPLCGGTKTAGTTTFTADLGSGVVVVRRVRATVCSQCGEEWIDDTAARPDVHHSSIIRALYHRPVLLA